MGTHKKAVIPAKAGIQDALTSSLRQDWTPAWSSPRKVVIRGWVTAWFSASN